MKKSFKKVIKDYDKCLMKVIPLFIKKGQNFDIGQVDCCKNSIIDTAKEFEFKNK